MKYISSLEGKLQKAKQDLIDYRTFVSERLNLTSVAEALKESTSGEPSGSAKSRDDDTHYFSGYAENGEWLTLLYAMKMLIWAC